MEAINYWMARGVRIPGWVLVRSEISTDAKVLYGVLLDEDDAWSIRRSSKRPESCKRPLFDAADFCQTLSWDEEKLNDARNELVDFGLVFIGLYPSDDPNTRRFNLLDHEWSGSVCFSADALDNKEEEGEAGQ